MTSTTSSVAGAVPADRAPLDDVTVILRLFHDYLHERGVATTAGEDDELSRASRRAQILSSWVCPGVDRRTWVKRTAALPMRHQPGAGWLYQTSFDALSVVLQAATGRPLPQLLREVVLDPLGMSETAYSLREDQLPRVPALFFPDDQEGMQLAAPEGDRSLLTPPPFPSLSTGLLSTVGDVVVLGQLLLDRGRGPHGRLVSAEAVAAMPRPAGLSG